MTRSMVRAHDATGPPPTPPPEERVETLLLGAVPGEKLRECHQGVLLPVDARPRREAVLRPPHKALRVRLTGSSTRVTRRRAPGSRPPCGIPPTRSPLAPPVRLRCRRSRVFDVRDPIRFSLRGARSARASRLRPAGSRPWPGCRRGGPSRRPTSVRHRRHRRRRASGPSSRGRRRRRGPAARRFRRADGRTRRG